MDAASPEPIRETTGNPGPSPVTVFVHSRNRPLYLWASLDSLYRGTVHPHRFVFVDMASDDPLVRQVVAGFERRGMFAELVWVPRNTAIRFWTVIWERLPAIVPYFAHVETDVIVEGTEPCWLSRLAALMDANPRLAMLGAAIDERDFVSLDEARRVEPQADEDRLKNLIKFASPERGQDLFAAAGSPVISPYNPPGRILLVRTSALAEVGAADDGGLHAKFIEAGYETGIARTVRHRHLSLLHIYDHPQYDYDQRDAYVSGPV
jgi:hypothetical protein